jgi:hypothetical protein
MRPCHSHTRTQPFSSGKLAGRTHPHPHPHTAPPAA